MTHVNENVDMRTVKTSLKSLSDNPFSIHFSYDC